MPETDGSVQAGQAASAGKPTVLLVDDDAGMLKIFAKYLEHAGYAVATAGDGEEALARVKACLPHLVILDIMLPKLNGYEVCTALKQDPATRRIPIIMFTAKGEPQEHVVGLMMGADAYLNKSTSSQELLAQVHRLLVRPAAS
jgi:DNA-binding response OmpR family regulator